jgi:hypothetical protein
VSPELQLIVAPRRAYAALSRMPARVSAVAACRRPLLAAAVIGASVAITATGRATPPLVLSTTLVWSYVVLLQLAIAVPLIAPAARRTVGVPRAIDLFFAGHAPWSLFFLTVAAVMPLPFAWATVVLDALMAVPAILTARIVAAFFREVLAMDARAAWRWTAVHQATSWAIVIVVNWRASAFTPRILQLWRL